MEEIIFTDDLYSLILISFNFFIILTILSSFNLANMNFSSVQFL